MKSTPGSRVGDISDVILVGGQTRMPKVQEMVKSISSAARRAGT